MFLWLLREENEVGTKGTKSHATDRSYVVAHRKTATTKVKYHKHDIGQISEDTLNDCFHKLGDTCLADS